MKKALKVAAALAAGAALLAGGGVAYLRLALPPHYDLPAITLPTSPERLENGRYLAENVALCLECHSTRDKTLYAGPVDPKTLGGGGEAFPGDFGVLYAPNITPAGLEGWSDQDLYRAVATGVTPDDNVLFPLMPFPHYATMDKRDMEDILAYIRQLKPIQSEAPPSQLNPPLNLIVRTMSKPATPQERPSPRDSVRYGAYITNMAACTDCHTPMDKGAPIPGLEFAGGNEFPMPSSTIRSANITMDKETGIGSWTREAFIARFKRPDAKHNQSTPLAKGDVDTIMPWRSYAGMTDQDLGAIYDYLQSLPAVKHPVERFTPKG